MNRETSSLGKGSWDLCGLRLILPVVRLYQMAWLGIWRQGYICPVNLYPATRFLLSPAACVSRTCLNESGIDRFVSSCHGLPQETKSHFKKAVWQKQYLQSFPVHRRPFNHSFQKTPILLQIFACDFFMPMSDDSSTCSMDRYDSVLRKRIWYSRRRLDQAYYIT